jgi:uncharacterized membrane protein YdbT with pleckstrin-like domain
MLVPFPSKLLNDNEEVIVDLHPHWSTLAKPAVGVFVGAVMTVLLGHFFHRVGWIIGAVVLVLTLGWFGLKYLQWANINFAVTTDRLVYRSGVLAKHGKEIPLERVNDISYRQTVLERIIGTGDLSIESAGAQSRETFEDIPRPAQVQNEIYRQMEAASGRHADRMAGRRELSIPEQIDKLDELRQRGVISQAEFDLKKSQLLDRM